MSELFHRGGAVRRRAPRPTVRALIERGARRLRRARSVFRSRHRQRIRRVRGAGAPCAGCFHTMQARAPTRGASAPRGRDRTRRDLLSAAYRGARPRRVPHRRKPGSRDCRFSVDARVLMPRSPHRGAHRAAFRRGSTRRELSGCSISVLAPGASLSPAPMALSAGERGCGRYLRGGPGSGTAQRPPASTRAARAPGGVRSLPRARGSAYDIIVTNPPYVGARELKGLPAEYRHEPRVALAAGAHGLGFGADDLAAMRHGFCGRGGCWSSRWGTPNRRCDGRFRRLPFIWLEFERGGGGVFLLTREQLQAH